MSGPRPGRMDYHPASEDPMNHSLSLRSAPTPLALSALVLALSGCPQADSGNDADAAKHTEDALGKLAEPVGKIAAYIPYVVPPSNADPYAPKRTDLDRGTIFAANEIRHVANHTRQRLQRAGGADELKSSFGDVAAACADIKDETALGKCTASVKALDEALGQAGGKTSAKIPRVGPDAITADAKKAIDPFVKAQAPSDLEKAFVEKRADPKVSAADTATACENAAMSLEQIARAYDKADEDLRLVAVTRHMSLQSQCNKVRAADVLHKELVECGKKKPLSDECKTACGRAKGIVTAGVPAASLKQMETDHAEICED
jgi:hypothetical protein